MKNFKKLISMSILALTLSVSAGLVACGDDESGSSSPSGPSPEQTITPSITLNKSALTLDLEQTVELLAETQGLSGEIVWSSSNPAVATVEAGLVTAINEGETEITATCGEYSAKCSVSVTSGGKIPVLKLNGDNEDVKLMLGEDFTVLPALMYNGVSVDDVTYTYSVDNDTVASVDANGKITGKTAGSVVVQVKAEWKTFTVHENFTVEYVSQSYIQANEKDVTIYTSDVFGNETSKTLSFTVVQDSVLVENPVITYTYDEDALSIENNVVSLIKKENATYEVTATYGEGVNAMSVTFTVKSVYPVKDMTAEYGDYAFEAMSQTQATAFDCFTDGSSVIGVYDMEDEQTNIVQNGKLAFNKSYYGERTWLVHSSNGYAYQVQGKVVTKIITTAEEFREIFMTNNWTAGKGWTTNAAETYYDGYYVLGNDIEFTSPTYNDSKYKAYNVSGSDGVPDNAGFNGTFDGQGHTISNIWLYSTVNNGNQSNGIFGTIGVNGVVKNVAFVNGGGCNWIHCYLANSIAGTVDNVFLQVDLASYSSFFASNMGILAYRVLPTAKIKNVVTYLSGEPYSTAASYSAGVSSFATRVDAGATLSNNYTVLGSYAQGVDYSASNYTADQLKFYTGATLDNVVVNKSGFVEEYWDLTDDKLPTMKSMFNISQPKMSIASDYALSGDKVEISLNCFEYRYFNVVASAGVVSDGGNGEGQHDKKYVLDLAGVANQKVVIELRVCGKVMQTLEINVGGTGTETEVDLQKRVTYSLQSWNASNKTWVNNTSDLAITGLNELSGKTVSIAYLVNDLLNQTNAIDVTLSGTTLTVPASVLNGVTAGELKLYVVAGTNKYLINLSIVTAELTTEEQFVSVFLASEWHGKSWKYDASNTAQLAEMTYDGYYVLGNDINFSNTYYVNKYRTWGINSGIAIPEGVGFNGIFDGKGYTINNLGITNFGSYDAVGGVFGTIGSKGVIKNVAFTNGRMAGSSSADVAAYFANGIAGTIENVFLHIDLTKSSINNAGKLNVFAYGYNLSATFTNVVAYVSGSASQGGANSMRIGNYVVRTAIGQEISVTNSYVIHNDSLTITYPTGFANMSFKTETQVKGGEILTTTGYGSIWDTTTYKMPIFVSAKAYLTLNGFAK